MSPLSGFLYTFRNWLKIFPFVAILAFSILGVNITAAVANSATTDLSQNLNFYDKFFVLSLKASQNLENDFREIQQKLGKSSNLEYFLPGEMAFIQTKAIVAQMRRPVVFLKEQDQSTFLQELGLKKLDGQLPTNNSEISFTWRTAKNKGLNIGDKFGSNVNKKETWLIGEYRLSGTMEFENVDAVENFQIGLGLLDQSSSSNTFFIRPKSGKFDALTQELNSIQNSFPRVGTETFQSYSEYLNDELGSISRLLSIITLAVSLTVTLSVGLLGLIFLNQRSEEIGLLIALGYSQKFVLYKVVFENAIQIFIGWLAGIGLAGVSYWFLNQIIFDPQAISGLTLLQKETFTSSISVPLAIFVVTLTSVLYKMYKIDAVAVVEKR